jgi:hypothetical protein
MTIDMDQTKHQCGLANLKAPRKMIQPLLIVEPESTNLIDDYWLREVTFIKITYRVVRDDI